MAGLPRSSALPGMLGFLVLLPLASGCAPVRGYPDDPEDVSLTLGALQPYFSPSQGAELAAMPAGRQRQERRNLIVMNRMRAYDLEFAAFERKLNGDANAIRVGGDLVLLTLTGLTATTGGAAAKAALGAASAGIVGAQAAIDKDLYYQKTLPALLAQMAANRAKVKLSLLQGLAQDEDHYPLFRAEMDLDALKRAGSVPASIENITQAAVAEKVAAEARIAQLRTTSFTTTSSSERLKAWLFPNGDKDAAGKPLRPDPAAFAALQAWMKTDPDPGVRAIPPGLLVVSNGPGMEEARQRALASRSLNIP